LAACFRITIKPDIVIGPRLHPKLMVDAKWTSPFAMHLGGRRSTEQVMDVVEEPSVDVPVRIEIGA
jgi:hypothetical protein